MLLLQDQFLSKRQEADAITQPLLDTENGFIKVGVDTQSNSGSKQSNNNRWFCLHEVHEAVNQNICMHVQDLEHFLNHRDMLSVRKRELLHKRWTECVWWPVQRSVEQRFTRRRREGAEPTEMMHTGVNYSTRVRLKK